MEKPRLTRLFLFMNIDATSIDADLDDIFSDFNQVIVIATIEYSGMYEQAYVETDNFSGFKPVFTGKTSEMDLADVDDTVSITSDIDNITSKPFTVEEKIPVGRSMQLVLHEV